MLIVRPQDPFLIKERSSHPPDPNPPITQHSHLIGLPCSLTLLISFPMSQGPLSCFGSVCSHNPHQLPLYPVCCYCSLFIILVSQPTSFPIFIQPLSVWPTHTPPAYTSFSRCCLPFVLPFSWHHHCIINTRRAESLPSHSHLSHVTCLRYYKCVDSVAGCSSALLSQEILYPSQVSVPVKDKLEFLGRSLAIHLLSSYSDSSLFICNYSGASNLEYLSSSSKDLQFWGTHHDLSRSSSTQLVLRGNRIAYQASSIEARRGQLDPLSGAESLGCEWPWQMQHSQDWNTPLGNDFDHLIILTGTLVDVHDHAEWFSHYCDCFHDQLSQRDPTSFPCRGPVSASASWILEIMFGWDTRLLQMHPFWP